jgi:predicted nucleotidyltransferase component of viral defense system
MDEKFELKYRRVLDILPDVSDCANKKLVLVGGTALALFHLNHRISIDLDFVPLNGKDVELKENLKGCLTKKGYKTKRAAHTNQFVIQFEDTSIKVEVFETEYKINKIEEKHFSNGTILVASIEDILEMKIQSYMDRQEARDLFDIVFILKERKKDNNILNDLIAKGEIKNIEDIKNMVLKNEDYEFFQKVIGDASKTSS